MKTRIKILILAHNPDDLGLLQYALKMSSLDYISEVVQNKADYEKALRSSKPDIILADYSLPPFGDLSAFRIRQQVAPNTPFIIVSGTIGEENAAELIRMGVTDYLLKDKMYQITAKIYWALNESGLRKQKELAEQQLRQREQQLRKIMDLSLDVICTLDQEGRFVTIGAACKSSWGYCPEELLGRRAIELVHPEDQERTRQAIGDLKHGLDMVNYENRYIRKDGAVVILLWSVHWDTEEELCYCVAREVTEIRQAAEKIKNIEKRFRALLQNSSDGLSLLAADGRVIERSPSSLKILGLADMEVPGQFNLDLVHPDDRSAVRDVYTQVRDNADREHTLEYRFLMPDGSYKWLEQTFHNQLEEPAVAAIVLNYRDITEKKIAEIDLRTGEARLKQAQAIGHMGSWEMNWADKTITWSDEMYRMMGVGKNEITPSLEASAAFVHPDDQLDFFNRFEAISVSLEDGSLVHRVILPDGEIRYVNMAWRFEFDEKGKPVCLFGILQDITRHKLTETALEESEEKYRNLFHLSPIPMWVYDVDTLRFLEVNEAAIRHYGYSEEEFLSMTLRDIRPQEEIRKLEKVVKVPRKAISHHRTIFKHSKKSGALIDVEIQANLVNVAGREARLVIATDISERIKYIQAVQEQNRRLREIAWTQSHVVRAPLARLLGLVTLLKDYPDDQANDIDMLDLVLASAQELDSIIRGIVRKSDQIDDQPILEERL